MSAPGWYPDPHGEHQFRYWDGAEWTDHVHDEAAAATGGPVPAAPLAAADPIIAAPIAAAPIAAAPVARQRPITGVGPRPLTTEKESGNHAGIAWLVALVIVAVVFLVTYAIASAVEQDEPGDGAVPTVVVVVADGT